MSISIKKLKIVITIEMLIETNTALFSDWKLPKRIETANVMQMRIIASE